MADRRNQIVSDYNQLVALDRAFAIAEKAFTDAFSINYVHMLYDDKNSPDPKTSDKVETYYFNPTIIPYIIYNDDTPIDINIDINILDYEPDAGTGRQNAFSNLINALKSKKGNLQDAQSALQQFLES